MPLLIRTFDRMLFRAVWTLAVVAIPTTTAVADGKPFFPIMIWDNVPADSAVMNDIKDCGITVCGFVRPNAVKLVQQLGMKAIVQDPRAYQYDLHQVDAAKAHKNIESLVAEVNSNPAVIGYYLDDEPDATAFDGLGALTRSLRELAPGTWPYINLFPNYATPDQMQAKDYNDYVEKFIRTCKPTMLSYDHYALLDGGALRAEYWSNLEVVRSASIAHHIPFEAIVLSCAHFNYREPSEADFRFQAYSTLAYGARGIAYFKYFCPPVGNYRAAPIDPFGHKTATWGYLQRVNLQILKLAPILLKLRSTDVYHFGDAPAGTHSPSATSLLSGGDPHFMAGDFKHEDGSDYVMLVNKDVQHSYAAQAHPRSAVKKIDLISPYSGEPVAFDGEQIWVAPGQGILLKLQR